MHVQLQIGDTIAHARVTTRKVEGHATCMGQVCVNLMAHAGAAPDAAVLAAPVEDEVDSTPQGDLALVISHHKVTMPSLSHTTR